MTEYDENGNELSEEDMQYVKAMERKEKKEMYRESRAEVVEFEAEIQAEQHDTAIWQGVCRNVGLKSQDEFLQLQRSDPAKVNLMISDYHKIVAGELRGGQQKQFTPQTRQAVKEGGMGFIARHPAKPSGEISTLKEKGRETQLSDDELLDVLNAALK